MFDNEGRPLPLHRQAMPPELYVGSFQVGECQLEVCKRMSCRASLTEPATNADVIPPLYDAVLRYAKDGELTLSGVEVGDLSRKMTAMSWRVRFIPDEAA
jgi:hypothetical protein